MLLKHQYLKFAYVGIVLMVSKMFRGNLTADMLAIGVTVVLISEIDTNCRTISALNLIYFKHAMIQKEIYNATNGRLQGGRNTEGNLRGFTVVMCCEKRSSSVGVIMHAFV